MSLPNRGESGKIELALPKGGGWLDPGCFYLLQGAQVFCCPLRFYQRGDAWMVTYADLFQYSIVIIGIVGLFLMYLGNNKKK